MARDKKLMEQLMDYFNDNGVGMLASEIICDDVPTSKIVEHIELLMDRGYIKAVEVGWTGNQLNYRILRITDTGYDFIDSVHEGFGQQERKE